MRGKFSTSFKKSFDPGQPLLPAQAQPYAAPATKFSLTTFFFIRAYLFFFFDIPDFFLAQASQGHEP